MDSFYAWFVICSFIAFFTVIPVAFVVAAGYMIWAARQRTLRIHEAWKVFAQANGLTFDPGSLFIYPSIKGTYQGRAITLSIQVIMRRRGRGTSKYFTVAVTPVKAPPQEFMEVSDRDQSGFEYETLIGPEIALGNERFAAKYVVKGSSPELAHAMLDANNQLLILEREISHLRVKDGQLIARYRGFNHGGDVLQKLLDVVTAVAPTIEGVS